MKRFISIITVLILTMLCVTGAYAETDGEYADNTGLMKGLEIFESDFDKSEEDSVTRADFVKYVLKFRGIDAEQYSQSVGFYDVDEMSSYAADVNASVNLGFASGYGDGSFRPEEAIICEHAEKIMVMALGGDELLKAGQATVTSLVGQFGIAINANGKSELTYGMFARLLKKALSAKPVLIKMGDNKKLEYSQDDALWVYHKIEKLRGIVTANDVTGIKSVNDAAREKGYIKLDGVEMQCDTEIASDILGVNVEAYVCMEDEEEPVIKYMTEMSRNEITVVQSDKICDDDSAFSAYNFVYENQNGKKTEKKLDGNTYVIYNGIAKTNYSRSDISPKIGRVTLVDNNSDGKIDVMNVFNADISIVSGGVSTNSNFSVITDKFDSSKIIRIDTDNIDDTELYIDGELSNIDSIKEDMLIIKGENGDHMIMYAYSNTFTGKLDGIYDDEVVIDGERYNCSETIDLTKARLGGQYRFYADDRNYIFGFGKIGTDNELHYGYLLDCKSDRESGELDALVLKVLSDENVLERFYIHDKIKVNNKNMKLAKIEELLNPGGTFSRQPIRYKVDENSNITVLHTVTEDGELRYEGEFTADAEYAFYANTWAQKFYQDSETLVFCIFDDIDSCYVEGAFKNTVINPRPYTHYFYNVDEDLNTVDMVVWKRSDGAAQKAENIQPETKPIVVTQVCEMLDSDDDVRDCIIGMRGSDELKVYYNDKMIQVYKDRFREVKVGDIIYCEFDGKGNLNNIFMGFDSSKMQEYGTSNVSNTVNGIHQTVAHARKKLAYLKVTEKLNNRFIKYDDGSGDLDKLQKIDTGAGIYKVINSKRGVTVSLSSYDEIMPGDEIFFDADTNSVWNMYILEYK